MHILYSVSIGQHHVSLHLIVWWPWLLPVSCFAARFCHCTNLLVSVEGHHQTCLPLQESLTARCMVVTKSMPVFEGVLLHFHIFYCQEHLPWPIFYVALSLSFLWARHDTSKLLIYFGLPQLVHTGKCVHDIGICWVLVLSVGCDCAIYLVHKAWFDKEFFIEPLSHLQNSPQELSFIFWHWLSTCCPPPSLMAYNLAQLYL